MLDCVRTKCVVENVCFNASDMDYRVANVKGMLTSVNIKRCLMNLNNIATN